MTKAGEHTLDTDVDAPTRIEGAISRRPSELPAPPTQTRPSTTATTRTTTITTPREALALEEIRRTRAFTRVSMANAFAVIVSLPFVGGDSTAKLVVAFGMASIAAAAIWLNLLLRDESSYTVERALVFGFASVIGGYAGIYFFGVFSPAIAVIPMGLYFFSVGQSFRATLAIYLSCALCELGLTGGILLGLIEDRGLVRAGNLGTLEKSVILALVEVVFLATFLIARASRKALLHAIEERDEAVRGFAQRDALLKEARFELEQALKAHGLGRFSDETLGSFRLGAVIGRGGMGEVYEATHIATDEPAAVKLLVRSALADVDRVRRFLREAKIISSLDVPTVVRVLEVGDREAPVPYIAMERLIGYDLSEQLRKHRKLPMPRVLTLVREVGRGLDSARAEGIVHRDIKPQNLFLAETGESARCWKILDFGVSRLVDDQGTLTRDAVVGTPSYMAPEQAKGGRVDHRADLFSLGVIVYRALTGRPAFTGDVMAEVLFKVTFAMPPCPSSLVKVHEDVDAVLAIAMAKRAEDRFDTAAEFAAALERAARGELDEATRARASAILGVLPWDKA